MSKELFMRRDFLKLCSAAGLGMAMPLSLPCIAEETREPDPYDGPFYVVFNASGGWDTTYLMDPKGVGEINRLYKKLSCKVYFCNFYTLSITLDSIEFLIQISDLSFI